MFVLFCLLIFFCVLWAALPEIKLMMMMISIFWTLVYCAYMQSCIKLLRHSVYAVIQRWMFSTAFDPINKWTFTDQPSMAEHLKVLTAVLFLFTITTSNNNNNNNKEVTE